MKERNESGWLVEEVEEPQREEEDRGGREAADDGATSRLVKAFQFHGIGNAKKGNHSGEAQARRDRRNALYRRDRDSVEGPHEEAEIQRKTLRRGKNLAFSKEICLEKERVRLKVTPKKVKGFKRRRELNKRRWGWRLAWWGSTEENSYSLGLRGRHQYSDQRSNWIGAPCVACTTVRTEGRRTKWPDCQRKESSWLKKVEKQGDYWWREKNTGPRTDPCGTPRRTRKEQLLWFWKTTQARLSQRKDWV